MEQKEKLTKEPSLLKKTRAQLLSIIEELKADKPTVTEEYKKAFNKLRAEKENLYAETIALDNKVKKLATTNQELSHTIETQNKEILKLNEEIFNQTSNKRLWKFWTYIFMIISAISILFQILR